MSNEREEKLTMRAKSIAAMGLVNREGDKFKVGTPSLRGKQSFYHVWRNDGGKIVCDCLEFKDEFARGNLAFRCEHILAVKHALVTKNTGKPLPPAETEKPPYPSAGAPKREDLKVNIVGFSVEPENGLKGISIQYCNGVAIFRSVIEISENCPNAASVAREIVSMLNHQPGGAANPVARGLSDLCTAKQLGMIRALCRQLGIDPDEECFDVMSCKTDELSRRGASNFIQHLQDKAGEDAYGNKRS